MLDSLTTKCHQIAAQPLMSQWELRDTKERVHMFCRNYFVPFIYLACSSFYNHLALPVYMNNTNYRPRAFASSFEPISVMCKNSL